MLTFFVKDANVNFFRKAIHHEVAYLGDATPSSEC